MSRKRALKKLQKRQESVLTQLEELYLQGAGDEFLALAEQLEDPAASPLAAEWTEMVERAVHRSLACGDLGRIERLLRPLRRSGRLRSLAVLVEAVLDLAAGRLEAARNRLASLAAGKDETLGLPPELLPSLQGLAQDGPDPRAPYFQATQELFSALQRLEAGACAPAAADRENLARHLEAVRSAAPAESGELHRFLDGAGRCLSLLAGLAALLEGDRPPTSQEVAGWLQRPGPLLAVLDSSGPPLLAPLQHAVRLRWHAVLERVAAREGAPGLAALWMVDPKLLAHDVALPCGSAALRETALARQLLSARCHEDLARLLRSRSRTASDSGELAALWSLELWAIGQVPDEEETELPPHRKIVRLQQMAEETGKRFPPERRTEVARVLRGELFDVCQEAFFCEHVAWATLSLLEHLPDDIGLLMAGVAGASAGEDAKALKALEARLARGIEAQARDLEVCRRLMIEISHEDPWYLAPILERLRPLFAGDAWPEIATLVACEMGGSFARTLREESLDDWGDLSLTRSALDSLRPLLAGTPGFAAIEAVLDCWQPNQRAAEKRIEKLLSTFPDLDAPLAAFKVLDRSLLPWSPKGGHVALDRFAQAVIDRLDGRWQLWCPSVPFLAMISEAGGSQRLEKKIRLILSSPELAAEGREALEQALAAIRELEELRKTLESPRGRNRRSPDPEPREPPQPKRKPRARRSAGATPQLQLDL